MLSVAVSPLAPELLVPVRTPQQRAAEISSVSLEAVRFQKTAVWNLLFRTLKEACGQDPASFHFYKTKHGKWLCDECYFSLSHTSDAVAVAVSDQPVGIDVENLSVFCEKVSAGKIRHEQLIPRVCSPKETELAQDPVSFLRLWTGKEAIFKSMDEPVFTPNLFPISDYPVSSSVLKESSDFIFSVCSPFLADCNFPCKVIPNSPDHSFKFAL